MNRKPVLNIIGYIISAEAALLLIPALVGLIYWEKSAWAFLLTALICGAVGGGMVFLFRQKKPQLFAREGFAIVALGWLMMSALGALPFTISGDIPNYIDALFETVSGFTTTGSTVVADVESMSHASLFWRSFTHWLGGMGVLIFIMAVIPNLSDSSIHIMKAEMPGPTFGKLVPRARDTAKILYIIYIALTVLEFIMLLCGGMPVFDSLLHTFGTAGTGGFGIKNDSVAGYSPYIQWVITAFMVIFGINFNLFYLLLLKRFKSALSSIELWFFISVFVVSTAAVSINILSACSSLSEAFRLGAFQTASVMSTTGYSTADFNQWPILSKGILFILMLTGACAGSTAGGFKMSRVIILFKSLRREVRRALHPRSVSAITFEGKVIEETTITSVNSYLALYVGCLISTFLLLCFDPNMGLLENISASVACFNNIGPGFGDIGPASTFAAYSPFSKIVLSLAMLAGRLEIYPLLLILLPSTWSGR